ncbi:RNA polymerase II transcription initiation/nucleotide excision repair factor TFIIH, subunit TFB4 [Pseudoloma neurophilia]|uniref:RNA polymerase II transcription initiation/nucleotide excision repair factor TFIIH, subunit TFB4 n=1 Tax=Pseudoloma neurophilia TaxID=146866 RepID=A0A0R0M4B1_9MICR|nr:RNA polymerase II transcription initiation/nucleotide excision repair factor TFIIH, subunit TFB4 [Pseudoloma neurophilia]
MSDLYLIVDLFKPSWSANSDPNLIINNIMVLINTHLSLSFNNRLILISNLEKIVIDGMNRHEISTDLFILKDRQTMARDIGLAMALINAHNRNPVKSQESTDEKSEQPTKTAKMVVISLSKECKDDYMLYLKSAFVARRLRNDMNNKHRSESFDIFIFSKFKNFALFELGNFFMDFKLVNMLSIFTGLKHERVVLSQARCICHGKTILYGMTCPVCLSVYCKPVAICQKCRARFNFKRGLK